MFHFHCFSCLKRAILNSLPDPADPADPPDPADQVSETAARTYLPHAPGVRMTVVKLTPSNVKRTSNERQKLENEKRHRPKS